MRKRLFVGLAPHLPHTKPQPLTTNPLGLTTGYEQKFLPPLSLLIQSSKSTEIKGFHCENHQGHDAGLLFRADPLHALSARPNRLMLTTLSLRHISRSHRPSFARCSAGCANFLFPSCLVLEMLPSSCRGKLNCTFFHEQHRSLHAR